MVLTGRWAMRTCLLFFIRRKQVVMHKVGEQAFSGPANPPMGFGPAWIVQHAPMSGAGTLVTAAADG
jgi:hypothetical protein